MEFSRYKDEEITALTGYTDEINIERIRGEFGRFINENTLRLDFTQMKTKEAWDAFETINNTFCGQKMGTGKNSQFNTRELVQIEAGKNYLGNAIIPMVKGIKERYKKSFGGDTALNFVNIDIGSSQYAIHYEIDALLKKENIGEYRSSNIDLYFNILDGKMYESFLSNDSIQREELTPFSVFLKDDEKQAEKEIITAVNVCREARKSKALKQEMEGDASKLTGRKDDSIYARNRYYIETNKIGVGTILTSPKDGRKETVTSVHPEYGWVGTKAEEEGGQRVPLSPMDISAEGWIVDNPRIKKDLSSSLHARNLELIKEHKIEVGSVLKNRSGVGSSDEVVAHIHPTYGWISTNRGDAQRVPQSIETLLSSGWTKRELPVLTENENTLLRHFLKQNTCGGETTNDLLAFEDYIYVSLSSIADSPTGKELDARDTIDALIKKDIIEAVGNGTEAMLGISHSFLYEMDCLGQGDKKFDTINLNKDTSEAIQNKIKETKKEIKGKSIEKQKSSQKKPSMR